MMTEAEIRERIAGMLVDSADEAGESIDIRSFEDVGLLTSNEGLVVRFDDGTEAQVTIVRSS